MLSAIISILCHCCVALASAIQRNDWQSSITYRWISQNKLWILFAYQHDPFLLHYYIAKSLLYSEEKSSFEWSA